MKVRPWPLAIAVGTLSMFGIAWQVDSLGTVPPSAGELVKQAVQQRMKNQPKPSATGPHPKAVCEHRAHEFGTMAVNTTGEHVFEIRNEGEAPLLIKQGLKSCKCTKADLRAEPVAVGETCKIPVTWDLREIDETFYQVIHFHTNDPATPTITLSVKGRSAPKVIVYPTHVWDLGVIDGKSEGTLRGGAVSPLLDGFEVLEIKCGNPSLTFERTPMNSEELAEVWAKSGSWIDLKFAGSDIEGKFRIPFYIVTNQEDVKVISCAATGRRIGPVRVVPRGDVEWQEDARVLDLGSFSRAEGKSVKLSLFIAEDQLGSLALVEAKTTIPGLKVSLTPGEGPDDAAPKYYELTITIEPGSPPLSKTKSDPGFVAVKTDHPDVPEWRMQIHAISN